MVGSYLGDVGWECFGTLFEKRVYERSGRREDVEALTSGSDVEGLVGSAEAKEYFRAERYTIQSGASFAASFAIIIVLEGRLKLKTAAGSNLSLWKGTTVVVPYFDGVFVLEGEGGTVGLRGRGRPRVEGGSSLVFFLVL